MDSLHIAIPNSSDNNDSFNTFNRSKRSSVSSVRSNASMTSPYEPSLDFLSCNDGQSSSVQRRASKKGVSTFISKLYNMVEDGLHQNLISWNPSGTSFFVSNATQFAQQVLPEYFKHSNFSSFVRLLNMYGFHKINKSPRGQRGNNENEIWEFSHLKFQHSRPDLLKEIKRKAMDSELLRRETGDIHASFATLQMSQADLLQQFKILQDNFSNLMLGFEETRKVQLQQQTIISQLAERQGLSQNDISQMQNDFGSPTTQSNTASPLTVFVTSPTTDYNDAYNTMQFANDFHQWDNNHATMQHSLQEAPDVTMSMYDTSNSPSPIPVSPNTFDTAVNTPLPPSPVPSVIFGSPIMTDHHETFHPLKYEDVNTLGLGLS
ncbi:HSF-type DNA-binding-domain-containing protein [Parasitella parasitica]|nr:HSF-type DNA-binding-domain-containing protein [Parasitella parasitica]